MGLSSMHPTIAQTRPLTQKPFPARPRTRGSVHLAEESARSRREASGDCLARARAARIIAVRQLMMAIERAERRYEETAELGREFDRRLERMKADLHRAGYLGARRG